MGIVSVWLPWYFHVFHSIYWRYFKRNTQLVSLFCVSMWTSFWDVEPLWSTYILRYCNGFIFSQQLSSFCALVGVLRGSWWYITVITDRIYSPKAESQIWLQSTFGSGLSLFSCMAELYVLPILKALPERMWNKMPALLCQLRHNSVVGIECEQEPR